MLSRVSPTVLVVAGLVVFLSSCATLVGLYALSPSKPDVAPLFAGIPGALAFLVTLGVAGKQRQHGAQLAQITHQTNGVLTSRIRGAVGAALAEYSATLQAADAEHQPTTPQPTQGRRNR